jgi:hypothetical protein
MVSAQLKKKALDEGSFFLGDMMKQDGELSSNGKQMTYIYNLQMSRSTL